MLQLWVLRLFKSLGKQRKTAVLVIGKKPPEKRNGTKSPWKNGGKFGNITNSFEVCGLFSGAKWLVLGILMGWDTPWKINMEPQNEGLVQNRSDDFPFLL